MDLIILFLIGAVGLGALACALYSQLSGMSKSPLENFHDNLNYLSITEREEMNERILIKLRFAAHGALLGTIVLAVAAIHNIIQYLF